MAQEKTTGSSIMAFKKQHSYNLTELLLTFPFLPIGCVL